MSKLEGIGEESPRERVVYSFSKNKGGMILWLVVFVVIAMGLVDVFERDSHSLWQNLFLLGTIGLFGLGALFNVLQLTSRVFLKVTSCGIRCDQIEGELAPWEAIDRFEDLIDVERFREDRTGVIIHYKARLDSKTFNDSAPKLSERIMTSSYVGPQERILSAMQQGLQIYRNGTFNGDPNSVKNE